MIEVDDLTLTYDGAASPVLRDVSWHLAEGELAVVVGRTGSGKSTLLGTLNGLVPHATGGTLDGRVRVAGRDTAQHRPRDMAEEVGVVGQDPEAGFVTDVVEDELAYGMEQIGLAPSVMRTRVEEVLDLLNLAELRRRPLATLSGGQAQRVAIGAVLTAHPSVLVLDEPTSALDPVSAEDVLAAISRLVHDVGLTVVVAEHRLERIAHHADVLAEVTDDGSVRTGAPEVLLDASPIAPPVVDLARTLGWTPRPLSVRDARRHAGGLRADLAARRAPARIRPAGPPALVARRISVAYDDLVAVRHVDLELASGQVTALMGRNGSGKSSLLWALQGSGRRSGGRVDVSGTDPGRVDAAGARRLVGLVPQRAADLLYLPSVADECAQADAESDATSGTCRALLDSLVPGIDDTAHPRDLSEGQRLSLVLAVQLSAAPDVVLLDEPTRGLDVPAKARLADVLDGLAHGGAAVAVATHDVEFAAVIADRAVVMADGDVVVDGSAGEVLTASPAFAPQTARIVGPGWLTPADVAAALGGMPA